MRSWPNRRIALGGDYNPEQWPRELWPEDMELMREAGVTFVTLGVFSWSWLEPAKGEYDFAWLDDIMEMLHANDIAVDLATATSTPPPWLSVAHPEILPVDHEGHTLWPGSRQAWCPSSPVYRDYALALTTQLAQRYHDHPALAMWHVSNEYACHNVPCYCDTCAAGFRVWLRRRHETLERLNDAWGTAFWSQRYTEWEQVLPPRLTTSFANPTQVLDYKRFQSDALLDFHRSEKAILEDLSPGVPVTTNFMTLAHFDHLDYHQWAGEQDVISTDHYVVAELEHPKAELAFSGDLTRGLAGGRPWLLMEHSTSAVNWQPINPAKLPGGTLRDSLAHVARGADTLGFFQWRQSRSGSEKFHSALVPHAGRDSARFREVVELGLVAERLGEVLGSRVEAQVAILWDYQAQWAAQGPAMPSSALKYPTTAHAVHRVLRERGITTDVVHPSADLSTYKVVVVPTLYLVSDEHAAAVAAAAEAGAQVLVTFFSGISDTDDHVRLGGYPGAFRDLLGVRVEEFFPLMTDEQSQLEGGGTGSLWSEDVTAVDTEVLDRYAAGPLTGRPAVTRRSTGTGAAWYLSTLLDDPALGSLLDQVTEAGGVAITAPVPPGVEAVRRSGEDGSWLFLVNDTTTQQLIPVSGHDLVADRPFTPDTPLAAGAVAVIREA
ncbi:MAG: beta-galactosidase [Pedococcus sp.]